MAGIRTCQNYVTGIVYLDLNTNGVFDPFEPYVSGRVRLQQGEEIHAETTAEAETGFVFANVPCGSYQIYLDDDYVTELQVTEGLGQSHMLSRAPVLLYLPHLFSQ
jgi:hypothetical protein